MGAAARAGSYRPAANKAAPLSCAGKLFAVRADHVDVKQPRNRIFFLDRDHPAFGFFRSKVKHEKRFASRFLPYQFPVLRRWHRRLNAAHAFQKRKFHQGSIFYFPWNIHRKANNGVTEPLRQRPLFFRPAFARREHFIQGDL